MLSRYAPETFTLRNMECPKFMQGRDLNQIWPTHVNDPNCECRLIPIHRLVPCRSLGGARPRGRNWGYIGSEKGRGKGDSVSELGATKGQRSTKLTRSRPELPTPLQINMEPQRRSPNSGSSRNKRAGPMSTAVEYIDELSSGQTKNTSHAVVSWLPESMQGSDWLVGVSFPGRPPNES